MSTRTYHYARKLETRFKKDVGGVSLAVDHSGKKMWVWADCDEDVFEANVLAPHLILKTEEFLPYIAHLEPKPDGCKAVEVLNRFGSGIQKEYFFSKCGVIKHIRIYGVDTGTAADIHFADTAAVDRAMERRDEFFKDSKMRL